MVGHDCSGSRLCWGTTGVLSASEAISPQWWAQFGDPDLDSLLAKAQIAETPADALPSVDVAAGTNLQKTPRRVGTFHPERRVRSAVRRESIRVEYRVQVRCIEGALDPRLNGSSVRGENALPQRVG